MGNPHLWLAALLSIAIQAPVLYWNWTTGFASFDFHLNARHAEGWLQDIRLETFVDFPAVSAVLVSPFLIPVFVRFFLRRHETRFETVAKGLSIWVLWLATLAFVFVSPLDWVWWWWNLVAYILVLPFAARHTWGSAGCSTATSFTGRRFSFPHRLGGGVPAVDPLRRT